MSSGCKTENEHHFGTVFHTPNCSHSTLLLPILDDAILKFCISKCCKVQEI